MVFTRSANLLMGVALLACASQSLAATCPEQPPLKDKRLEGELSGKAQTLAKLGTAELSGHVKTEQTSVLNHYPNADRLMINMSMLSMFCQALNDDKTLSANQRIDRITSFRRELMR